MKTGQALRFISSLRLCLCHLANFLLDLRPQVRQGEVLSDMKSSILALDKTTGAWTQSIVASAAPSSSSGMPSAVPAWHMEAFGSESFRNAFVRGLHVFVIMVCWYFKGAMLAFQWVFPKQKEYVKTKTK